MSLNKVSSPLNSQSLSRNPASKDVHVKERSNSAPKSRKSSFASDDRFIARKVISSPEGSTRKSKLPPISPLKNNLYQKQDDSSGRVSSATGIEICSTENILRTAKESDCSKVFIIDLHGSQINSIRGLKKFTRVKSLDLSGNFIQKIEGLDSNQQLKELKLYDNKISEIESLDCLKELQNLQLQYNAIGCINEGLKTQVNLSFLRLDNNKINSLKPYELSHLSKSLVVLNISNNLVADISALTLLTLLEELNVSKNGIQHLPNLKPLSKLSDFDCSENHLTTLKGLQGNNSLVSLNASKNDLTDQSFFDLSLSSSFITVEVLDIACNKISRVVSFAKVFPNVNVLNLAENVISDMTEVDELAPLEGLLEIDFRGNPILPGEENLSGIFPDLEMLNGKSCQTGSAYTASLVSPLNLNPLAPMVEKQMRELDTQMSFEYADMIGRFNSFRTTIETQLPSVEGGDCISEDRPLSKCKSRIIDAKNFAHSNYEHKSKLEFQ